MNKAIEVCIRYEKARTEIIRLTRKIGEAAEVKCENHSDSGGILDMGQACIERLWSWNKQARLSDPDDPPEGEQPKLCPRCAQVDRLIQQRKKAKQEYGVAKRAVSAVGRAAAVVQQIN